MKLKRVWVKGGDISARRAGEGGKLKSRGRGEEEEGGDTPPVRVEADFVHSLVQRRGEESASATSVPEREKKKKKPNNNNNLLKRAEARRALFSGGESAILEHLDSC